MADILEFRRPDSGVSVRAAEGKAGGPPKGRSAEIIIFPGVRIERRRAKGGDDDRPVRGARRVRRPAGVDK